jgi:hypothetical protein
MRARAAWMLVNVTDSNGRLLGCGSIAGSGNEASVQLKSHQPRLRVVACVLLELRIIESGSNSRAHVGAHNSDDGNGEGMLHVSTGSRSKLHEPSQGIKFRQPSPAPIDAQ